VSTAGSVFGPPALLREDWSRASADLDEVFRALADPSRRLLLDALYTRDGQTLGELCRQLRRMTRFGVMKHLRQLEAAGLVSTRRVGREKIHYLNPVPIRLIHNRWIRKYDPWVGALTDLKRVLEESPEPMDRPSHVYELYIRTSPERLWRALISPEYTQRYFYGSHYESSWELGAPYRTLLDDGSTPFEGVVLEAEPPHRLVYTFHYTGDDETRIEQPSRVTWEIVPQGELCKLTVIHDGFAPGELATYRKVGGGWPYILSSLKSVLETGEPLPERAA
jgi:uncharacterized protein YndB with AHSA1/START domain/DNA-binding transcriptional ArsR family regulator